VEQQVSRADVDRGANPDWQQHHDQVKGISRVLFAFWVKNLTAEEVTAQFYISTDSSLATAPEVRSKATLVLDDIAVPARDSIFVTAKESYKYFRHLDQLTERLIQGRFCLYCIAEQDSFEIQVPDSAALMIEFTHAVDWEF
jgi:hypothetical protein